MACRRILCLGMPGCTTSACSASRKGPQSIRTLLLGLKLRQIRPLSLRCCRSPRARSGPCAQCGICITVVASGRLRPMPPLLAVISGVMWCTLLCLRKSSKDCFFCFHMIISPRLMQVLPWFFLIAISITSRPLARGHLWQINPNGIYREEIPRLKRPKIRKVDILVAKLMV
jgi:hypothetical protein